MTFSQLTSGTRIHVLEITGTFKKNTTYSLGTVVSVNSDITTNVTKDFKELDDLKAEVKELKQLLQNVSAVRPEVIKNTPPNSAEDKKVEPEGEIKKEI